MDFPCSQSKTTLNFIDKIRLYPYTLPAFDLVQFQNRAEKMSLNDVQKNLLKMSR